MKNNVDEAKEFIEVNPDTIEPVTPEADYTINKDLKFYDEEKENKKKLINEVMAGVSRKKYLYEFFEDEISYRQAVQDELDILMNLDVDKIHCVMKALDWKWAFWEDEDDHENSIPTPKGIRRYAREMIDTAFKKIIEDKIENRYWVSCGGFEVMIELYDGEEHEPDDFKHRVMMIIKFVVEQWDNVY